MKIKAIFTGMLILVGAMYLLPFPAFSGEHQTKEAKRIVALVNSAAALVESKGKDAFSEFEKKDGKWYKGKTYVFVDDMNGTVLVNPPSPEIVGKNLIDTQDAGGKALIREFIKIAETKGSGWVDYWWPRPGEDKPSRKMSFVRKAKMPDGKMVIVGAGMYAE